FLMGMVLWMMLEAEAKDGKTLVGLNDDVNKNPCSPPELRIEMSDHLSVAERQEYVREIVRRFEAAAQRQRLNYSIDRMDGAVIEVFDRSGHFLARALVRNSNNESVFGLAFEGRTFEDKHWIEDLIVGLIAERPYQLPG